MIKGSYINSVRREISNRLFTVCLDGAYASKISTSELCGIDGL